MPPFITLSGDLHISISCKGAKNLVYQLKITLIEVYIEFQESVICKLGYIYIKY